MLLLLMTGCNYSKIEKKPKRKINNSTNSIEKILKNYELIDYEIRNNEFIAITSDKNHADLIVYSLENEKIILKEEINDGPLVKASITILSNGFAINYGNNHYSDIYNKDYKLIKSIDFSDYNADSVSPICVSQDLKYVAFMKEDNSLNLLNLENDEITNILSLDNNVDKLSFIFEMTFLDNNTLCYIGATYLKYGEQSTNCYGTIDIASHTYKKINSDAVTLSTYENKALIHNQAVAPEENSKSISYYFDGTNGKSLTMSLTDSINARLTSSGIIFIESGDIGVIKPKVTFNDKEYGSFDIDYTFLINCTYYNKKLYLYGYVNETLMFSIMEIE
ncbi:hypothetical protein [Thomasclavelia cocleata]|uniref:hypothetical protein n=1 Tax=Thomasclavelia cocleata TaxID=69824 RepID=UPI003EB6E681